VKLRLATFLVGLFCIPVVGQEPSQAKTELEGSWEGVYSVTQGLAPFKLKPGLVTLQFTGDKLLALNLLPVGPTGPINTPVSLGFALNTKASPKQIDYWQTADKKIGAVYELKGDELHLAVPESGEKCGFSPPRPKAVGGEDGSCAVLLVLKKK
jgi:uncharacterized protein (TIGR03067 family)